MRHPKKSRTRLSSYLQRIVACCALASAVMIGCSHQERHALFHANDVAYYSSIAQEAFYENPHLADPLPNAATPAPRTLLTNDEPQYWDLTLDAAIQYALSNSSVLRDLGGSVLTSPDNLQTTYSVALQETDPQFGVEAALSAFDAQFAASAIFEGNDRALNNEFFGGGTRVLTQDLNVYQTEISKIAATGTELYVRNFTDYDDNNAPGNQFGTAWNSNIEMEFRHPLLQGGGTKFNRIAGPNATAGSINGVLIARTNKDISQADFEVGVRNFVNNVANAYWDLYFSYRDLDAKVFAREKSLEAWRRVNALKENKQRGGEEDREALAQEQYYRFEEEVQNSLTGRQGQGTQAGGGSTGGNFRGTSGVHVAERRLRLIMGMQITDNSLIRPSDEPEIVKVFFDWDSLVMEAVARRPEIQRQRLRVRQREMELVANRNFLMPRLDFIALNRWRGFGRDLFPKDSKQGVPFNSALQTLTNGGFQEWQLGMELTVPIGYRSAHSAVQNAELMLAKERAILHEQERQIVHDLSGAVAELDRAYAVAQTNLNRYRASRRLLDSLENLQDQGFTVDLDRLLDAQRRVADAESRYFLSQVEYIVAMKNINLEKGGLLEYYGLVVDPEENLYADAEISDEERSAVEHLSHVEVGEPVRVSDIDFTEPPVAEQSKAVEEKIGIAGVPAGEEVPQRKIVPVGLRDAMTERPANRVLRLDKVNEETNGFNEPVNLDRYIPEASSEPSPRRVLDLDEIVDERGGFEGPVVLDRKVPETARSSTTSGESESRSLSEALKPKKPNSSTDEVSQEPVPVEERRKIPLPFE